MRKLLALIAPLAFAATAQAATPLDGEERLARALEGRVAGAPVDCISLRNVNATTVIDDTAIIYRVGSTLYVNRPRAGADSLNRFDTMVSHVTTGLLCSIDVVRMTDLRAGGMLTGLVFLGEFVPYRRTQSASID